MQRATSVRRPPAQQAPGSSDSLPLLPWGANATSHQGVHSCRFQREFRVGVHVTMLPRHEGAMVVYVAQRSPHMEEVSS